MADPPQAGRERPLRELVRHTLVYGSGYVTMAAASFVLVPVYTFHLTPAEFGLLALMLVLYGLMTQVYDLGFTNSVGRFFFDATGPDSDAALRRMRGTALVFLASYGGALTIVLCLLADTWSRVLTGTADHADLVRIVAVTLYAEALAIVPLTLIRMQERSRLYVAITVARFVMTLALNVVFVVVFDWGVRGIVLGNAISAGGVLLILLPDLRPAKNGAPSWPLVREMLAFGLPFFPVLLAGWLIEASDRYLLELFRSREEVGLYGLAYKVGQVMQIAVAAFSMGWAPLRYRIYSRPGAQEVYRRLTTYYVVAAALLAVAIAVFAREIVTVVAPASYREAADVVPLIALGYALQGLYLMMVTGMGVSRRTAPMAWIGALGAAVNIGLNLLLIPRWGMTAAALTTVFANAILVGGAWLYSQRFYPIPYDWRRMARVAVIATVVVSAAVVGSPSGLIAGFVWAAVAWLVFVVALVKAGVIGDEELAAARDWLRYARSQLLPGVPPRRTR